MDDRRVGTGFIVPTDFIKGPVGMIKPVPTLHLDPVYAIT